MNDTPPPPSRARMVEADREDAGQRIDNFLARHLKGVPKSRIYRILRKGEVRVNKRRVKPDYRVQAGDQVRIPPLRAAERDEPRPAKGAAERVEAAILHEDSGLIVLDKPAGMAVHGGSGLSFGVIEALRAARPEARFLELVHRLDRETSGCLMVAKKRSVLRSLHELLRGGGVDKRYLALVRGNWGDARLVEHPLRKNVLQGGERVVRVDPEGKPARTRFKPLERYRAATLVEAELFTGRTHQIRVHAAAEGHPLAGDERYGDESFNRELRELGLKRLFLHAHSLTLQLPGAPEPLHLGAPLPEELRTFLDRLES